MKLVLLSVILNMCFIHAQNNYITAQGKSGKLYLIETEGGVCSESNSCSIKPRHIQSKVVILLVEIPPRHQWNNIKFQIEL